MPPITTRLGPLVIDATSADADTVDGQRSAAITEPTGGATQDAEARAAIDDILAALRKVGIIAE